MSYSECQTDTTFDNYLNTFCQTGDLVYHWPIQSLCWASLGTISVSPSDLKVNRDPNGLYTLLFLGAKFKGVGAGDSVKVVINHQITGAVSMNPWLHDCIVTGDGFVRATQNILDSTGAIVTSAVSE